MASGGVHAGDSLIVGALGATSLMAFTEQPIEHAICVLVGSALGILLSPDLDQDGTTISEIVVWKLFAPIGFIWQWLWYGYARAIPHRHWSSHGLVVGTVGRVLYMLALWWVVTRHAAIDFWAIADIPPWVLAFGFCGLALSDATHLVRDKVSDRDRKRHRDEWERARDGRGEGFIYSLFAKRSKTWTV